MIEMRHLPDPAHYARMSAEEIRRHFLIPALFENGALKLVYLHSDRMIIGGAVPGEQALSLPGGKELAAEYFAERRELGVINLGGAGKIRVDEAEHALNKEEMLYIGKGSREIALCSEHPAAPARYFLVSLPAHTRHPTRRVSREEAHEVRLGDAEKANQRVIRQYIHEGGANSCQLVMGFTELAQGSVWNTMPPHTHERRSEVYLYFDLEPGEVVFHLMGPPQETRHIVMREGDAVISPSWSIHAGSGTQHYKFVWAMGGENQAFDDMDFVPMHELA